MKEDTFTTPRIIEWMTTLYGCDVRACGSQVTCNPAPGVASDYDYIVLVPTDGDLSEVTSKLETMGFDWEGSTEHYQMVAADGFLSYRRKFLSMKHAEGGEHTNFILTKSRKFFERHALATAVCQRLNLMEKAHRIILFQAILYGHCYLDSGEIIRADFSPNKAESNPSLVDWPRVSEPQEFPF